MFTVGELFDVVLMTVVVGYIFMDLFRTQALGFDGQAFKFACLVTAPAIIVHELAHKIVALSFGLEATFHAAYLWLFIGVMLKLMRSGFIFFVPAYVSIGGGVVTPLAGSLTALAGPLFNAVMFIGASVLLRQKRMKKNMFLFLQVTKQINLFLFVFNMLPIPGFDGFKVYAGLFQLIF